jgi:hypothetical protein
LVRNAETHEVKETISFRADRMITAFYSNGMQGFRIFPRWQTYDELPVAIQTNGKTARRHHDDYRDRVGGRLVMEVLQDAIKFFLDCDPSIARLAHGGQPVEFPLEGFPLPVELAHGYERPHPYFPGIETLDADLRRTLSAERPTGAQRIVERVTIVDQVVVVAGYTELHRGGHSFTETAEQVAADIDSHGYPYLARIDGALRPLTVSAHGLLLDGQPLTSVRVQPDPRQAEPTSDETWRDWFSWAQSDAKYWASQRRAH